jgi:hypothetical protein
MSFTSRHPFMDLIVHDPGRHHVSLEIAVELEKTIMADPRVRVLSSKASLFSSVPNIFWRTVFRLARNLRPDQRPFAELSEGEYRHAFAVLMGLNIRKTMPRFLLPGKKSIYLFDAWPQTHAKIRLFAEACQINHLFISSSQGAEQLGKVLTETACHWIPEGIHPERYWTGTLPTKDIDILQLGRRFDRYHELVAEPLARLGKVYLYEKVSGKIIFPTHHEYMDGLARAKISICVPSTITHPALAGGIETMTVRFLQSMISKCLIVGHAPQEMTTLFGYNPVIEIDYNDPVKQLEVLLKTLPEYQPLIEKNYRTILEHHTWRHRWAKIAAILFD